MNKDLEMEQQIVDKITALIKPENLHLAKILLQENKGNDSINTKEWWLTAKYKKLWSSDTQRKEKIL